MGSRTPEHDHQQHGDSPHSEKAVDGGGEPRGSHSSRDGDGCLGDNGDGDEDGDDDERNGAGSGTRLTPRIDLSTNQTSDTRKKRKKPKKKKAKTHVPTKQSSPPRVPMSDLFPSGEYPKGELQDYQVTDERTSRTTADEIRYEARRRAQGENFLPNYRKAAEVHRQARKWIQETIKPGDKVLDIAEGIEDAVRALLGNAGLETGECIKSGMGFPTGICLNNQVAHYTPNPGQKDVIVQQHDTVTIDFGVHINGWIVDSAFTVAFDPTYDNLLAAVKDATNTGIKTAGIDVRISDISAAIQETMESYEVEIRGKMYRVKPVQNLSAHNIDHYHIHGGKSIPFVKNSDQTKMEEEEVFAIETFGTTGRGYVYDDVGIYGYGLNHNAPLSSSLPIASAKRLHKTIRDNFGTIVFCRRYIERLGVERYLAGMNCLVSNGIVEAYKPLADIEGSYSAQFEHTFVLHESHKEILSRGDDY